MSGTCSWPIDRACLPPVDENDEVAVAKQQAAADLAVSIMWSLSGRQFGVCPVLARPCPSPCLIAGHGSWLGGPGWYPVWSGDTGWRNVSCGCDTVNCSAVGPSVVHLPGPVVEINEVTIDGAVLDPSNYALEAGRLYRRNGAHWPRQDLLSPLGEVGTWSVDYDQGIPVPAGVGVLVGILTLEFLNACSGGKCRLPRRVTSVTRNGVSYQMVDPTDIYAAGKTGLSEVDLWLSSVNPYKLLAAPTVR